MKGPPSKQRQSAKDHKADNSSHSGIYNSPLNSTKTHNILDYSAKGRLQNLVACENTTKDSPNSSFLTSCSFTLISKSHWVSLRCKTYQRGYACWCMQKGRILKCTCIEATNVKNSMNSKAMKISWIKY